MIVVVLILVILILSVILAFQFGKKSTPRVVVSKPLERGEEEDTSTTATSRSIETEPPEDEDPGTCETTGDWAMSGECQADGTAIFTQTYKESKPGACPSNDKARVKPCCYQKGDWTDTSGCNEKGRKTQKQTTINCAENFKTREVDCPYVGPWSKTGGCGMDGKQHFIRDVINSVEPKQKTAPCSYVGPWNRSGVCGPDGKQTYNRIVINSNQPTSKIEDCCHMGKWKVKTCLTKSGTLKQERTRTKGCGGSDKQVRYIKNACTLGSYLSMLWAGVSPQSFPGKEITMSN